jgi:hypothetical protein
MNTKKNKKGKFSDIGKTILKKDEKPKGISSFLSDDEQDTETRKKKPKAQKKVREEFRLPADLAEKLRKRAFEERRSKVAIVIEALEEYL